MDRPIAQKKKVKIARRLRKKLEAVSRRSNSNKKGLSKTFSEKRKAKIKAQRIARRIQRAHAH